MEGGGYKPQRPKMWGTRGLWGPGAGPGGAQGRKA